MKHTLLYIAIAASALFASCDDNFTHPPVIMPPCADVEPTTTMLDFKTEYWSTLSSPITVPYTELGDTIIFTGRVCSSDESGNIYKNIIIQSVDENGEQVAMTFAVNAYDIYQIFPYGQEVAVYASGLQIGGYSNLLQFGAISGTSMTFMGEDLFKEHVIRNHFPLPQPEEVVITHTDIPELMAAKVNRDDLIRWQSRLIRVDGVSFEDAGQACAPNSTVNRYVRDADGNRLNIRCSSYATFKNNILPSGSGSVTGILSYYGSDWQVLLNDWDGLEGFDEATPEEPGEPVAPVEPVGDGSLANPYNVAAALSLITGGNIPEGEVHVKGKISAIKEISTSYGNAEYTIVDEIGQTDGLIIYRGYWLNGEKFTKEDQLAVGAEVVVLGTLVNYMGNTPEMTTGSKIISYNGQTGGTPETPEVPEQPEPAEGELYTFLSDALTAMPTDWTIEDTRLPEGLTYIWAWKTYQNKGYLNASAYANNTAYESEAYAISPVIDLTGATGVSISFEHAAKFQTTLKDMCGVVVREENSTEWTLLEVPVWPTSGTWDFTNSGEISLEMYQGKKIQLAFKYGSSTTGADTWEIRNLSIKGNK